MADKIAMQFNLTAEVFEGPRSVGVGGDMRTFTPVVNLIGDFPGHEVLATVSNRITSELPVNRVTFQLARRTMPWKRVVI